MPERQEPVERLDLSNREWAKKNLTLAHGQATKLKGLGDNPEELGLIRSNMAIAHALLALTEVLDTRGSDTQEGER